MNNKVRQSIVGAGSITIALLVLWASLMGLFAQGIYGQETLNWALQARGQDIGNLLTLPVLLAGAYLYRKGSFKGALLWLGALLYLVYAYIVYAMAVHFNSLFLVYVAVLGLCSYAILLTISDIKNRAGKYPTGAAKKFAAVTIIAIGILFALLWLSELIPALLAGTIPQSLKDAGLWVNPIHVIDLAIVLPAFILTGFWALKNHSTGLLFLAPWLVFAVLMGLSIVAAMLLMASNGFRNVLPPMVMVTLVVVFSFIGLWGYWRKIRG